MASEAQQSMNDLELMRHFDDELEGLPIDELDEDELEALLDSTDGALDKLAGLHLAGELLREAADGDERADGIADAVMGAIENEGGALNPRFEHISDDGTVRESEPPVPQLQKVPAHALPKAEPANDNSRSIYMLFAAAAAVAAGLFVWGRGDTTAELATAPTARTRPVPTIVDTVSPETTAPAPALGAQVADLDNEDDSVEVASVDFGSNVGSVFYVDGDTAGAAAGAAAAQMAVVWVTDEGSDGDEL